MHPSHIHVTIYSVHPFHTVFGGAPGDSNMLSETGRTEISYGMSPAANPDLATLSPPAVKQSLDGSSRWRGEGQDIDESAVYAWEVDMAQVMCTNTIASGAFGTVFHGLYKNDDVAVKVMKIPKNISPHEMEELKQSFKQEIAVWSKLKHPNVVQFIGASFKAENLRVNREEGNLTPGQPVWAIITEFMSGGTLKSFLNSNRVSTKRVVKVALDIGRGMEYLHARNIVHRDLKSENLLLSSSGDAKLADFGVARTAAEDPVDMTCETGTVRWMAPEVIDHQPYNHKVDVYSFGIVLWELVTGDHPFRSLNFVQLAYAVVNKNLRPEIPQWVPKELSALMQACWDAVPESRPEFTQVVEVLERYQEKLISEAKNDVKPCCATM